MNNNTFIHKYLKPLIGKDDICADMTAGNGNDTLFLAKLARKVYAFDIAEEAITNTRKRTAGFDNVILIRDTHANADTYIKEPVRLFIFNLGYLPYSGKPSITNGEETLKAFRKAYQMLERGGYIAITFYFGQAGGLEEYLLVSGHIQENGIFVMERYSQDRPNSPLTLIIRKS